MAGSFGIGPDRMDFCITTDLLTSTINMDKIDEKAIGGTPDFVADQIDLSFTRGLKKGLDKTMGHDWMAWVSQNWVPLIIFMLIAGIALTQFNDKLYTGPQGWQAANNCEQSKQAIVAKCAPLRKRLRQRAPYSYDHIDAKSDAERNRGEGDLRCLQKYLDGFCL